MQGVRTPRAGARPCSNGAIEEGDLSVDGLTLEQLSAVADRRATISGDRPGVPRMRAG